MILLQFENIQSVFKELDNKVEGIAELTSLNTLNQVGKAVFTITSKRFLKDFQKEAILKPKKYFHTYEWNAVGDNSQKLFKIKRQSLSSGNIKIRIDFAKSKKPVPINSNLKRPVNQNMRSVTKRSVFRDKAEIIESGRPVTFTTKQAIVFFSENNNEMVFLPKRTVVNITNPGGKQTTHAFTKFVEKWYATKVDSILNSSGLFQNLESAVAKSMENRGSGKNASKEAIRLVTEKYAQGVVEI